MNFTHGKIARPSRGRFATWVRMEMNSIGAVFSFFLLSLFLARALLFFFVKETFRLSAGGFSFYEA